MNYIFSVSPRLRVGMPNVSQVQFIAVRLPTQAGPSRTVRHVRFETARYSGRSWPSPAEDDAGRMEVSFRALQGEESGPRVGR